MVNTFMSLKLALPVESTDAAIKRCPAEFTTLYWSFIMNAPLRVKMSWKPSADFKGKKPSPEIAKSKVLAEKFKLPCPNSCVTRFKDTP